MDEAINVYACTRGHRYAASTQSRTAACPKCDLIELMTLAYGDCQEPPRATRLLEFRAEQQRCWEDVLALLKVIGRYNHFAPDIVGRELERVFPRLSGIEIGREASPVLYARVPYWTHQAIAWRGSGMGSPLDGEERKDIAASFLAAMRRAYADEAEDLGFALRAWWD